MEGFCPSLETSWVSPLGTSRKLKTYGVSLPRDRTESINLGLVLGRVFWPRELRLLSPSPDLAIVCLGLLPDVSCVSEQEASAACEPVEWLPFLPPLYPVPGKMLAQLFFEFLG